MTIKRWRCILRWLRKNFPVESPVVVKRVSQKESVTRFDGRRYHIRIALTKSASDQVDSILHEWGHIRSMDEAFHHKGSWPVHFGGIYDAYEKEMI